MNTVRWGIFGPGSIARNFADGLAEAHSGDLVAIASRSADRRKAFGDQYGLADDLRFDSYAAMAASDAVDAIYVSTPHPFHAEQAILAMRADKHVVCEKPAGLIAGEVIALTEVARQADVFFMEAFMYRCHPQISRLVDIIASGEIGRPRHVTARLGFTAPFDANSRLYDFGLAGGGVLDVGCYPVSLARLVAGAADGAPCAEPVQVSGVAEMAETGVDQTAFGVLRFANGMTAEISCAVSMDMDNSATIVGEHGQIHLPDPWMPGRNGGPSDSELHVTVKGETRVEAIKHPAHLFMFEAELASRAILDGRAEAPAPAMSWADSIGNAQALDAWRQAVGYTLAVENPKAPRVVPGVMPSVPEMPMKQIDGVAQPISQLVMGCDNKASVAEGALVWDAWMEAGGNAFDTGFVYGAGAHETALGHWMAARDVADQAVVIVKGAHSPYCTPRAIEAQLDISLERLQLERAPIYIMHRDNPDIPVGEFVDALNMLQDAGKIGIFGGSNWAMARLAEANAFANTHGLRGFSALNNNLSLAVMERPIWPGCISANDPATLAALRDGNIAHFSWSSQARGYFLPAELRDRLPTEIGPDACFGSDANAERRRRAESLAKDKGVSAHNIATAWVLAQAFPSFALIGPRSAGEIVDTMRAVPVALSPHEVAWLNLAAD